MSSTLDLPTQSTIIIITFPRSEIVCCSVLWCYCCLSLNFMPLKENQNSCFFSFSFTLTPMQWIFFINNIYHHNYTPTQTHTHTKIVTLLRGLYVLCYCADDDDDALFVPVDQENSSSSSSLFFIFF